MVWSIGLLKYPSATLLQKEQSAGHILCSMMWRCIYWDHGSNIFQFSHLLKATYIRFVLIDDILISLDHVNQYDSPSYFLNLCILPESLRELIGDREKLKETSEFKRADEEEWTRRQLELQQQEKEVQQLHMRKEQKMNVC